MAAAGRASRQQLGCPDPISSPCRMLPWPTWLSRMSANQRTYQKAHVTKSLRVAQQRVHAPRLQAPRHLRAAHEAKLQRSRGAHEASNGDRSRNHATGGAGQSAGWQGVHWARPAARAGSIPERAAAAHHPHLQRRRHRYRCPEHAHDGPWGACVVCNRGDRGRRIPQHKAQPEHGIPKVSQHQAPVVARVALQRAGRDRGTLEAGLDCKEMAGTCFAARGDGVGVTYLQVLLQVPHEPHRVVQREQRAGGKHACKNLMCPALLLSETP